MTRPFLKTSSTVALGTLLSSLCFGAHADVPVQREPPSLTEALRYPHLILSNKHVRMTVLLPDAVQGYYRGTRFDWAGLIARTEWKGHTFYSPWKATHDPLGHDDVSGPAEEFGMADPPGYAGAQPGGTFLKIGVGFLVKEADAPYQFYHPYRLQSGGVRTLRHGRDWVEFTQDLRDDQGWGCRYTKRIRLMSRGAGFVISHRLQNTGTRLLETEQYCHNFVTIDDAPIGPDYVMTFPFVPRFTQDLSASTHAEGTEMRLLRTLGPQGVVYAEFTDFPASVESNGATIENEKTGASLTIRGDLPPAAYHLYCAGTAICPEPFVRLTLPPGGQRTWQTAYRFRMRSSQAPRGHTRRESVSSLNRKT